MDAVMRVQEGPSTFTRERVRAVVHSAIWTQPSNPRVYFRSDSTNIDPKDNPIFRCFGLKKGRNRSEEDILKSFCHHLLQHIQQAKGHVTNIDDKFSRLLQFNLLNPQESEEKMVSSTLRLLSRLPLETPPYHEQDAEDLCSALSDDYFIDGGAKKPSNLRLACFIPTNVIRFAAQAIAVSGDGSWEGYGTKQSIEYLRKVFSTTQTIGPSGGIHRQHLFILRTFLWTTWHRCLTLHRWYMLRISLEFENGTRIGVEQIYQSLPSNVTNHQREAVMNLSSSLPDYICRWAFWLITSDRMSVGSSLQGLILILREAWHHHEPRCFPSKERRSRQCEGTSPKQCDRCVGVKGVNQSAHAHAKDSNEECYPVYWCEESYRSLTGARAVNFNLTEHHKIAYRPASERTMAVTHVWSHGRGGRPESLYEHLEGTGFNLCLHQQFSRIASKNNCDSYWMDTPCIPANDTLRKEAIETINSTFWRSQLVLICDKDIMQLDGDLTEVRAAERLLATLLVCDWNVRAWTLLESYKGSRNLYLLCKDEKVVPLRDTISVVHESGNIDLVNLILTTSHLLPARGPSEKEIKDRREEFNEPNPEIPSFSIGASSGLLRRRLASRPDDEISIWSLLCGMRPYKTAVDFWKHSNPFFYTDFLMSDICRIGDADGFSWAPAGPNPYSGLPPNSSPPSSANEPEHIYDAHNKNWAVMNPEEGTLTAEWQVCDTNDALGGPPSRNISSNKSCDEVYRKEMNRLSNSTREKLISFRAGSNDMQSVLLIRPVIYRGSSRMVLVNPNNDSKGTYKWIRLIEWDGPLPPSYMRKIVLK